MNHNLLHDNGVKTLTVKSETGIIKQEENANKLGSCFKTLKICIFVLHAHLRLDMYKHRFLLIT